jgi:hypothetical protein
MSTLCCQKGTPNFGRANCVVQIDDIVGAIIVPTFTNAGAYNEIDLTDPFTASTLTGLITNADPSLRWVKLPRFYGADAPIADSVFDEATDGTKSFVREGIWSFTAEIRDKDAVPAVLKKLKALRCTNWAMFLVTRSNQLVLTTIPDSTTLVRPLLVNNGSLDPKMMFKNATTTNKIMFAVDFDNLMRQENLYVIDGNEINVDFLNMRQLTDVNLVQVGSVTTTTATVGLRTDFAMGLHPNFDVVGLIGANFVLKNLTDSTTVTITSVTESLTVDGQYDLVYPAQTSADVLELSLALSTYYTGKVELIVP